MKEGTFRCQLSYLVMHISSDFPELDGVGIWLTKRSEPWMSLFTSDFLRKAGEHSPSQSYRGLRGKRFAA
uniref:Uncharacterized protein n=1 Tax=Ascaris lumbricoides TaxID=6252 RepID=A0A0M3IS87_ASCLU